MLEGMLSLDQLKADVAAGAIDTVVVAMVDLQGRLVGKRFHARYFLDGGYQETHACNYLLGVDIEMEPVPGYKATSWEKGYGDYVHKPDLIYVSGSMRTRKYTDKDGVEKYVTEIRADTMQMLGGKSQNDAPAPAKPKPSEPAPSFDDLDDFPF
jgi:glutamine synthetase